MAGTQAHTIVDSCIWRLEPFTAKKAKDRFSSDELEFDSFDCDSKTAIFVSPAMSGDFDFLVSLFYTQLIDILCEKSV